LQRYHGVSTAEAGRINSVVYGLGGLGLFVGGWAADRVVGRRVSGRLEVAALALAVAVPCTYLALARPAGDLLGFALWMLPGCMLMYVYYSAVYATIQDIIEPSLRGTAMALYFFAMYLLGAAVGPVITGGLSDHYARQALLRVEPDLPVLAASSVGLLGSPMGQGTFLAAPALSRMVEVQREARAVGLHQAMYLIPALGLGLVVVLFAGSRTVTRDHRRLEERLALAAKKATV
jgi:MFS family permease